MTVLTNTIINHRLSRMKERGASATLLQTRPNGQTMRHPLESPHEDGRKTKGKNKRNAFYCLRTCPDLFRTPTSGAIPRVHKYLPSILNGHISWGGKKSERPSEIQRLNPSLGSRQYSERSIKACLPDVPFRSCTYTSMELLSTVANIAHEVILHRVYPTTMSSFSVIATLVR